MFLSHASANPSDASVHALTRLLPWPLPALLAWSAAWLAFLSTRRICGSGALAVVVALLLGSAIGWCGPLRGATPWRRIFIAGGFPLSLLASGLAVGLPAWAWLAPVALLALLYPVRTWRDAPVFPTPAGALAGLATCAPLGVGARVLDAGCGLGHGLLELQRAYPHAQLDGMEWSWPLRLAAGLRCRRARVRRCDMWAADWSGYDLVYLFQRPETMGRAYAKAQAELRPGAWLVSLEFPIQACAPLAELDGAQGRKVWVYRWPASLPIQGPA